MNLQDKFVFYNKNRHELVRAIFFCLLILSAVGVGVYIITNFRDVVNNTIDTVKETITPRYWAIIKITPNATANTFTLDLKSSIGNLRSYQNIFSYGLSQNGQFLAMHNNEGIYVVNLEDESRKTVATPADKYSGDLGEVIDWSKDDTYFSIPVVVQNPTRTQIWIYKKDGTLNSSIDATIPIAETGKSIVEPAFFSKQTETILVRTYKKEDLEFIQEGPAPYSIYDLPVYLTTFNVQGKKIEEFTIRDYDTSGSNVVYFWDKNSNYIEYNIYNDIMPDKTRDYLFTKLAINEQ